MNINRSITPKSTVIVSQSQSSSELLGETVILELDSGVYYGLNETGSIIWNLVQKPITIEEIQEIILSEYEIDPDLCIKYIINLLQDMASKGLVTIKNESIT